MKKISKKIKSFWDNKKLRNALLMSIILILLAIIIFDEISLVFFGIALIIIGIISLYLINQ